MLVHKMHFSAGIAELKWKQVSCNRRIELAGEYFLIAIQLIRVVNDSFWPGSGDGFLPTSHVKVSGGRVAHAFHVRRHALVLPLVGLLTVLDLQGTWETTTLDKQAGQQRDRERREGENKSREGVIRPSLSDSG